jgi:deoxyadenosine/deoxycytidine kinase
VIIWVNGPFGVGKTTVATQLLSRLPDAMLYDPETVGAMLRTYLPNTEADFQDLPPWRPLVAATAVELIAYTGQPLITPMSLLREDYAKQIFTAITAHGIAIHHIALHADRPTLIERIQHDTTHSDQAKAFRLSKIEAYLHAHHTWLANAAYIIDTLNISPDEVADHIAAQIWRPPDSP